MPLGRSRRTRVVWSVEYEGSIDALTATREALYWLIPEQVYCVSGGRLSRCGKQLQPLPLGSDVSPRIMHPGSSAGGQGDIFFSGQCTEECRWGSHWECSPSTEIRRQGDEATELTVSVAYGQLWAGGPPVADAEVRPCQNTLETSCGDTLVADARGEVFMTIVRPNQFAYLDVTAPDGSRMLAHPGRDWIGAQARFGINLRTGVGRLSDWETTNIIIPEGEDLGAVFVGVYDCVGTTTLFTPERTGVRLELVSGEDRGYSERYYFSVERGFEGGGEHGTVALFTGVSEGRATVRVYAPGGEIFTERFVHVRRDTLSQIMVGVNARGS
jgi:hypothetical protein